MKNKLKQINVIAKDFNLKLIYGGESPLNWKSYLRWTGLNEKMRQNLEGIPITTIWIGDKGICITSLVDELRLIIEKLLSAKEAELLS